MNFISSHGLMLIFISIISTSIANPDSLVILNFNILASVANLIPNDSIPKIGQLLHSDSTKFNSDIRAAEFLKIMNLTVKPCNNFYEFVCGNYHTSDESGRFEKIRSKNLVSDDIKDILAEASPPDEIQALKNVRNLYRACKNATEPIRENDLHTLKNILRELGGWPMLEGTNWMEEKFNWSNFIVQLGAINSNVFFYSTCSDSSHCMLKPSVSVFIHNRLKNKIHDSIVTAYFQRVKTYFSKMGGDPDTINPEIFEDFFRFDTAIFELFQSLLTDSSLRVFPLGYSYSISEYEISLDNLTSKYPEIAFINLINTQMQFISSQMTIHGNCSIQSVPSYVDKLMKLINQTPKKTLANYALIRFVSSKTVSSYSQIIRESSNYEPDIRSNACLDYIDRRLPLARNALYVRKYFSSDAKNKMSEIISDIKNQTKEQLKKIDFLDSQKIQIMQKRIDEIEVSFGYPDKFFNNEEIDKYYDGLVIPDDDLVQSHYDLYLYKLRSFKKSTNLDIFKNWLKYAPLTYPLQNSIWAKDIRMPGGFLHSSFFHSDQPNYLNYAGAGENIGTFMGIMSSNTIDNIKELMTQKLIKIYCKLFHLGQTLFDGDWATDFTYYFLRKNYFEHMAMNIAYSAYKNSLGRSKIVEPKLPGMNYTSEQMFWINVMYQKCSTGLGIWKHYINNLVNVMDSSGFREAFDCPNVLENPVCPAIKSIGN